MKQNLGETKVIGVFQKMLKHVYNFVEMVFDAAFELPQQHANTSAHCL